MKKDYVNMSYVKEDITDKIFKCSEIMASVGNIAEIYFCPYGLFIVLEELKHPIRVTYQKLRELLRVQHIYIYIPNAGIYDYYRDEYKEIVLPEETEDAKAYDYFEDWYAENEISGESIKYAFEELLKIEDRVKLADAINRGSYIDNDGNIFIKKENGFIAASTINQDKLYYFCLFGGCLGLHRFILQKYFTGVVYIFTFGLLGIGWLFDLAALVFGMMKDKKKRVILPLTERNKKLILIPLGVIFNAFILSGLTFLIFNI